MSDTNHLRATAPVEGDGVSYSGIVWFVVVLVVTVLGCEIFVWGMFKFGLEPYRVPQGVVAPLAEPVATPSLKDGRVVTGLATPPQPGLVVEEPKVLKAFRDGETTILHEYGWVNQGAQVVRLPIDRAKELLLERGLPIRSAADAATPGTPAPAKQK
jgi:hypothetical protein